MKKTDMSFSAEDVYLIVDNKKSVCLSDLDRYQLSCQDVKSLKFSQGEKAIAPANLLAIRQNDNLVVDLLTADGQKTVTAEGFYLKEGQDAVQFNLAHPVESEFSINSGTERYATLADGSEVIYFYGDQNILAGVMEDKGVDHYYELNQPAPETIEDSEENDGAFTWLGLGVGTLAIIGVASAATLGGVVYVVNRNDDGGSSVNNQEQINDEVLNRDISGTIVLGPLVDGHGLSVQLFTEAGDLLTTVDIDADGNYTAEVLQEIGQIKAVVIDDNDSPDYIDEATGVPKDLDGLLSAWIAPEETIDAVTLNINPLTTLAVELIQKKIDEAPEDVNIEEAINEINTQVAKAFLSEEADITSYEIMPVVDKAGNPIEGNAGGAVLSMISALEDKDGLTTAQVVESLANNLNTQSNEITLSNEVLESLNEAKDHLDDSFDAVTESVMEELEKTLESQSPVTISGTSEANLTEDTSEPLTFTGLLTVAGGDANAREFIAESKTGNFGSFSIDKAGEWVFSADNSSGKIDALSQGQVVEDLFTVKTADGTIQNIQVRITGVNDSPVVNLVDLGSIKEDTATLITKADLLAGASDPEGEALSVNSVVLADSSQGELIENDDDTWTFTPAANFNGDDVALNYNVNDGTVDVATSSVIDVMPVNDSPVTAVVDLGDVSEGASKVITADELLAQTTDTEGAAFSVMHVRVRDEQYGTIVDNGDGTWTLTPADNIDVTDIPVDFDIVEDAPVTFMDFTGSVFAEGWTNTGEEFHTDGAYGESPTGTPVIEMDSLADVHDSLSYTLDMSNNTSYRLALSMKVRAPSTAFSDTVEVLLDGQLIATIDPTNSEAFEEYEVHIPPTGLPESVVTIRERADENNGFGAIIDTVSIQVMQEGTAIIDIMSVNDAPVFIEPEFDTVAAYDFTSTQELSSLASDAVLGEGARHTDTGVAFNQKGGEIGELQIGGALTIASTFTYHTYSTWAKIIDFGNGSNSDNIIIGSTGQNQARVQIYRDTIDVKDLYVNNVFTMGESFHLTFTVEENGHMKIYIDGELVAENPDGHTPNDILRTRNFIGKSNWANQLNTDGNMDDLIIIDRAIDASEVMALYEDVSAKEFQRFKLLSVEENSGNGTVVGSVFANDEDSETLTFSLADDAEGRFAIDANTGEISVADGSLLDYESAATHTVIVRVSDGFLSSAQSYDIALKDINDAPALEVNTSLSVDENTASAMVVGSISAQDQDNDALIYSLDDDAAGRFAIDANTGEISVADGSLLDYESAATHTVIVRVSDGLLSSTQSYDIALNDINEASVLVENTSLSVDENTANDTIVGTVTAQDVENDTLTYSLDDNAAGRFAIDANTGEISVADGSLLDYESAASHTVMVQVSDGLLSSTQGYDIALNNMNEAPVLVVNTSLSVNENTVNGTIVGTVTAQDVDNDTLIYSLDDDAGSRFAIDANTGEISVADDSLLDFESAVSHTVTVRVTDGLLSGTQSYDIALNDVNDAPEIVAEGYTLESIIPELTSNSDQGIVVTASGESSTDQAAYMAMDGIRADEIYNTESWAVEGTSGWLQVDLGAQTPLLQYSLSGINLPARAPRNWELLGSNDGSTFDVIDIQMDEANWATYEARVYQLAEVANYQYYQINILQNNGDGHTGFDNFQLFELVEVSEFTVHEDGQVTLDVLSNDVDRDPGDTLTLHTAEIVNHRGEVISDKGMVSIVNNALVYNAATAFETIAQDEEVYVSIRYVIQDSQAAETENTVMVKVTGVNDVAVIEHRSIAINESETIVLAPVHLSVEDVDSESSSFVYTLSNLNFLTVSGAIDNGDDTYSFTQAQLEAGDISLTHDGSESEPSLNVQVSDGVDDGVVETFSVIFGVQNDEPVTSLVDLGATNEDIALTITQEELLVNAVDAEGDKLEVHHVRLADENQGVIAEVSEGVWEFTPAANFNADNIQIEYDIHDYSLITYMDFSNGLETGWTAVNDLQVTDSGLELGTSDTSTPIMASDAGLNTDGISYTVDTSLGIDHQVTLVISDISGHPDETIEVVWNNTVVATVNPASTDWETVVIDLPYVNLASTDLTIREQSTPSDETGIRIDSVSIHTAPLSTVTGTAEIDVIAVDDAPVIGDVELGVTAEDTPLLFFASDLLAGSSDIDSESLTVESVSLNNDADGVINVINRLLFMEDSSNAIEIGGVLPVMDQFTLAFDYITIGANSSADPIFSLATASQPDSLLVEVNRDAGSVTATIDGESHVFTGLTLNDGQLKVFAISWNSDTGSLKLYFNGVLYEETTLKQGATIGSDGLAFIGQDQDSYGAFNTPEGMSNVAMHRMSLVSEEISAEIIGLSQPLSFHSDQVEVDIQSVDGVLFDGTGQHGLTSAGSILQPDAYYVYTPAENYSAQDIAINFSVSDGVNTVDGVATIDINAVNDAPVLATNTALAIDENATNATIVGTVSAQDVENDTLVYSLDDDAGGRFAINASSGEISVVDSSLLDYESAVSHTVVIRVSDGSLSNTQSYQINLNDINDAPVAGEPITASTDEDAAITITEAQLLINASDQDGNALSASNVQVNSGNLVVVNNGDATWSLTPAANWSGTATLSFDVSDGEETVASQLNLTVIPGVDTPLFSAVGDTVITVLDFENNQLSTGWTSENGIEIKDASSGYITPYEGDYASELDFFGPQTPGHEDEAPDALYYTVDTHQGHDHKLSLWIQERAGSDGTDHVEIVWNGEVIQTIDPVSDWGEFIITLPDTGAATTQLAIREVADQNQGTGPLLDLITLTRLGANPNADPVSDYIINADEDSRIALDLSAALVDSDGSETLTVNLTGLPAGFTFTDGTNSLSADGSDVDVTGWNLGNLTITPSANHDSDVTLTVTTTATESNGTTATNTQTFLLNIQAFNDAPELSFTPKQGDVVAAYNFSDVKDITDAGHDLTLTGSAQLTDSGLLVMDGTSGAAQIEGLETGGTMTIATWVRFDSFDGPYSRIIDFGNDQSDQNIILARSGTIDQLHFQVMTSSGGDSILRIDDFFIQDEWVHVSVTIDETGLYKVYKDGELAGELQGVIPDAAVRTGNYIGKSHFPHDGYFDGAIDDFAYYDRALSSNEVADIYNTPRSNEGLYHIQYTMSGDDVNTGTPISDSIALPDDYQIGDTFWVTVNDGMEKAVQLKTTDNGDGTFHLTAIQAKHIDTATWDALTNVEKQTYFDTNGVDASLSTDNGAGYGVTDVTFNDLLSMPGIVDDATGIEFVKQHVNIDEYNSGYFDLADLSLETITLTWAGSAIVNRSTDTIALPVDYQLGDEFWVTLDDGYGKGVLLQTIDNGDGTIDLKAIRAAYEEPNIWDTLTDEQKLTYFDTNGNNAPLATEVDASGYGVQNASFNGGVTVTSMVTPEGVNFDREMITGKKLLANEDLVASFDGVDVDNADLHYTLLDDADGRFSIDNDTGEVSVVDATRLDFEAQTSHKIVVEVSDGFATAVESLQVNLTDLNDAPFQAGVLDLGTTLEDQAITFSVDDLLANVTYQEGATITVDQVQLVDQVTDSGFAFGVDTSSYIKVNEALPELSAFTFEVDYKSTGAHNDTADYILSLANANSDNAVSLFIDNNTGNVSIDINGAGTVALASSDLLLDGETHRVHLSWDSTTGGAMLYIDGHLVGTATESQGASIAAGGILYLGQDQDSVDGTLDPTEALENSNIGHVTLVSEALTAEQIQNSIRIADVSDQVVVDVINNNGEAIDQAGNYTVSTMGSIPLYLTVGTNAVLNEVDSTFTVTPDANLDGDIELSYKVSNGEKTIDASATISIDAKVDAPSLSLVTGDVQSSNGNFDYELVNVGDAVFSLDVNWATQDNDGSEYSLLTISGLPSGFTVSDNSLSIQSTGADHAIDLFGFDLSTLTVTPNSAEEMVLTFTATQTERGTDDSASVTKTLYVKSGNHTPIIDAPSPDLHLTVDELTSGSSPDSLNGTEVFTVEGHDQNIYDTLAYSLTDDAGGRFVIDSATGVVTVADASLLDYETDNSHTVIVKVSDDTGLFNEHSFTINVNDIGPVATPDAASVTEGVLLNGLPSVLANDSDGQVPHEQLTVTSVDGIAIANTGATTIIGDYGELSIDQVGDWTYQSVSIDLDSNLVAHWTFDHAPGETNVTDISTVGSFDDTLTLKDGASFVTGGFNGNAVQLDGLNDYILIPSNSVDINSFSGMRDAQTVHLSFNIHSSNNLVGKQVLYEQGGTAVGLNIYIEDGVLYAGAYSTGTGFNGNWVNVDISELAKDQWHQVAFVLDAANSQMEAWLDGESIGTASAEAMAPASTHTAFGRATWDARFHDHEIMGGVNDYYFHGSIDEARIYDRALNHQEVSALKNEFNASAQTQEVFEYTVSNGEEATPSTLTIDVQEAVSGQSYQMTLSNDEQTVSLMEPASTDEEVYYWLDVNQDDALTDADKIDFTELASLMDSGVTLTFNEATISLVDEADVSDLQGSETIADVPVWSVDSQLGSYTLGAYDDTHNQGYVIYQIIG